MVKIFDKSQNVKIDMPEGSKIVSSKLPDDVLKEIENSNIGWAFPYAQFEKYLRGKKDVLKLEDKLRDLFFDKLPHETICKDCPKNEKSDVQPYEVNCAQTWLEYQMLYILTGNNLVALIEANKKLLRKEVKQKMVEMFYSKSFEFQNAKSFFRIGEMIKYMLKEGLKETSNQLKQMEINLARTVASKNYHKVKEKMILTELGEPGFEDFHKAEKKYWKNKKKELDNAQSYELAQRRSREGIENLERGVLKGFNSKLHKEQIEKVWNLLLADDFIADDTKLENFKAIFSKKQLPDNFQKVKWIHLNKPKTPNQASLREFLKVCMVFKTKQPDQETTDNCLSDANGHKIVFSGFKKDKYTEYYRRKFITYLNQ